MMKHIRRVGLYVLLLLALAAGSQAQIVQQTIQGTGNVTGPGSSTDNAAVRFDSTTGKIVQNSALIVADTTGALSRTGAGGIPIQGTNTNDAAAAGNVGEFISATLSSGSAISLTTSTPVTITSISLTAGDWDVGGIVYFSFGASTTVNSLIASISTVDNSLDTTPGRWMVGRFGDVVLGATTETGYPTPTARISLAATTTIYMIGRSTFGISTATAYGFISARRVR